MSKTIGIPIVFWHDDHQTIQIPIVVWNDDDDDDDVDDDDEEEDCRTDFPGCITRWDGGSCKERPPLAAGSD